MAFYEDKDQEQESVDGQPKQVGQETGIIGAQGQTGAGDNTSGQGQGAAVSSGAAQGSPFVGINQYIDANKQQSAKLAGEVGNYVEGQGTNARNALSTGQEQFNQAVGQNTVNLNQDIFNTAKGVTGSTGAEDLNDAQKQEFVKMRDAQYKGPTSLETSEYWQPIDTAFNKANSVTSQSLDQAGQRNLLGQFQQDTRGRVNLGAVDFDSALLQGDQDARNILTNYANKNADLGSLLTTAQQDALARAAQGKQTTDTTRNTIQSTFGGNNSIQKQLETALTQKANSLQGQAKRDAEAAISALKNNQALSDAQLKLLDMTRAEYEALTGQRSNYKNLANQQAYKQSLGDANLYNDLSRYGTLVDPSTRISAQNAATAEDYARYAALNELMGTGNAFLTDPSLAGTANMDLYDYRRQEAANDIASGINAQNNRIAQGAQTQADDKRRAAEAAARGEQEATVTGGAVGYVVAGPVGAVVGAVFCFLHNTPIAMKDGTFKMVQDLELGDITSVGGMVIAAGKALVTELIEYKGRRTSPNHAIFDGQKWVRAKDIEGGVSIKLDIPAYVYPIVNESHILLTDNGVVYADLIEHDDTVGMSDDDKIERLNNPEYINKTKQIDSNINNKSRKIVG